MYDKECIASYFIIICSLNAKIVKKTELIWYPSLFKWLVTVFFQRACGDSTSERNVTEERPVMTNIPTHVPSHWSSMRPNVPYTRVALDTASAEFQEVEKLFKRSMNGRAVIEKIDRIQNPLICEEYCR